VKKLNPAGGDIGPAVNHRSKEEATMAKKPSKPISIRYTCPPDGNQVGLSHYLMAEAKKAK